MGSPEVLARATGSAAERACNSKSVITPLFRADRPLAGAPSLLGLPQRTPLEAKPRPPYSADTPPMVPQGGYRIASGLHARLDACISVAWRNLCKTRLATLRGLPQKLPLHSA